MSMWRMRRTMNRIPEHDSDTNQTAPALDIDRLRAIVRLAEASTEAVPLTTGLVVGTLLVETHAPLCPELGCVGDAEALWRSGRHRSPDRARRLMGSASSRSERRAVRSALAARSGHRNRDSLRATPTVLRSMALSAPSGENGFSIEERDSKKHQPRIDDRKRRRDERDDRNRQPEAPGELEYQRPCDGQHDEHTDLLGT